MQSKVINILHIGDFQKNHGVERLVHGLNNCKDKNIFEFHLFGIGDDLDNLINLTMSLNLFEKIHFYGSASECKIADIASNCDFSIVLKANYDDQCNNGKIQEIKKYLNYGLPIVYEGYIEGLDVDLPFLRKISSSNWYIDFSKLVDFYQDIENKKYNQQIKEYGQTIQEKIEVIKKGNPVVTQKNEYIENKKEDFKMNDNYKKTIFRRLNVAEENKQNYKSSIFQKLKKEDKQTKKNYQDSIFSRLQNSEIKQDSSSEFNYKNSIFTRLTNGAGSATPENNDYKSSIMERLKGKTKEEKPVKDYKSSIFTRLSKKAENIKTDYKKNILQKLSENTYAYNKSASLVLYVTSENLSEIKEIIKTINSFNDLFKEEVYARLQINLDIVSKEILSEIKTELFELNKELVFNDNYREFTPAESAERVKFENSIIIHKENDEYLSDLKKALYQENNGYKIIHYQSIIHLRKKLFVTLLEEN